MTLEETIALALAHMDKAEYSAAVTLLKQGHAAYPDDDDLLVLYAEALGAAGNDDKAVAMLEQRLEQGDQPVEVLFALADEYFVRGEHSRAIKCYKKLMLQADAAAEANVRIGLVKIAEQACEKAEEYFHKALQIDDNCLGAANSLGDLFFERGQLQQAINWYQRAIEIDPEDAEAYANMADVLYEQHERESAKSTAIQALELDDMCAPAWLTLGYLYMDEDDIDEACRCFEKFLELEGSAAAGDLIVEVNAVLKGLKGS